MARNYNGGTDKTWWTIVAAPAQIGTVALWVQTTQVTTNVVLLSLWNTSSRNGWAILLNNVANKISAIGEDSSTARVNLASTANLNDGNPHHIAFNWNRANGASNQLYVDGALDASANSSALWTNVGGGTFLAAGKDTNAFWAAAVADLGEIAMWWGAQLNADEIAALAKGFSPKLIRPDLQAFHAPMVRDSHDLIDAAVINSETGGSVVSHFRTMGGTV